MVNRLRPAIAFLLLIGLPVTAHAQSYARFSVEPSDPALRAGIGAPGTEFAFTADVSNAESYRFEFDDDSFEEVVIPSGGSTKVSIGHRYDRPDRYTVTLIARRSSGETIELPLEVRVEPPPQAAAPRPDYARFSVSPGFSDDSDASRSWGEFTFNADVSSAESYTIDFGDNNSARNLAPDPGGRTSVQHRYTEPGNYQARMSAARNNGETVEQTISVTVTAPSEPPSTTVFYAVPSDPLMHDDIETPWADFTFTAEVDGARNYKFDFDDGETVTVAPGAGGAAVVRHVFGDPGKYDVRMMAERSAGDTVESPLFLTVRAPPAIAPVPVKPNWWPWILLAGSLLLLLRAAWSLVTVKTGNHLVSFEPRVGSGQIRVSSSAAADDAISMRVRQGSGRLALAVNEGE